MIKATTHAGIGDIFSEKLPTGLAKQLSSQRTAFVMRRMHVHVCVYICMCTWRLVCMCMRMCGAANTILARANEQFCKVITFYPGLWQRTSATEVATTVGKATKTTTK